AADWLQGEDVMRAFLSSYDGGQAVIKRANYPVLAEFVPIEYSASMLGQSRVECDSSLGKGTISTSRWIKPEEQRHDEQRVAHLIVTLRTPEAANQAIREGLNIEGKNVSTRKLLREPRRCLKCQQVGVPHIAATCPAPSDVCGTCAGAHRTSSCAVKDKQQMRCCNCNTNGHAAWDRACPCFVKALAQFNERTPSNRYRFYPTADPSTWTLLD
ncbi:hypothetical protein C8Q80DRAFT_1051338, partial [Daedaleopsis nitida]